MELQNVPSVEPAERKKNATKFERRQIWTPTDLVE